MGSGIWRRYMDGHPTDDDGREAAQEVHSSAEVGDLAGVGINGQWSGCFTSSRDTSHDLVSLEKTIGTGSGRVSQGDPVQTEPRGQGTSEREPEAQRYRDVALSGADALEKKDELGLTGRKPGQSYSGEQRQRILDTVQRLKSQGVSTTGVLQGLRVPRSTFYFWKTEKDRKNCPTAYNALLEHETQSIVSMKEREAHLSHRHISGLLRHQDVWVSSSSCYRELKSRGMVWKWTLRESPWKTAHYEPYEPNRLWGEDWTGIVIGGLRHYVLTILDLFSRYLVAWGIFKTITQREVKNLVALAVMSQGLEEHDTKPILRTDPGSPNMAADVRIFLREIGVVFSPGRVSRPTDNARQERFYRTLKQEEVYCHDGYISVETARSSIGHWIEYYNEVRPHQALFGYPPAFLHRLGNKTQLLQNYRGNVEKAKQKRRQERILNNQKPTTFFTGNV
jgi:putative transposase